MTDGGIPKKAIIKILRTMRSELISAELYALPSAISHDSKKLFVSCGFHIMSYNMMTGKLVEATEAITSSPTGIACKDGILLVSDSQGSRAIDLENGLCASSGVLVSPHRTVAVSLLVSVMCVGETLCFVSEEGSLTEIYRGIYAHVSCNGSIIAAVVGESRRTLYVYDTVSKTSKEYLSQEVLTSTAVLDDGEVVSGDMKGRIVWWSTGTCMHWHAVPVVSLASAGLVLLSGGEEGVLCMWTAGKSKPLFIPRLGGPIVHITVSQSCQFAAVSLGVNSIVIVDLFTRSVQCVVEAMHIPTMPLVCVEENIVAICNEINVQIFDTNTRRPTKSLAICERNYLPKSLLKNAQPWKCKQFSVNEFSIVFCVLQKNKECMIKIFDESSKCALVCVVPYGITSVAAVPGGSFITANSLGQVSIWSNQSSDKWEIIHSIDDAVPKSGQFYFAINHVVIIAHNNQLSMYDPRNLNQIAKFASFEIVGAKIDIVNFRLWILCVDGSVCVYCLKKCSIIAQKPNKANGIACGIIGSTFYYVLEDKTLSCIDIELCDTQIELGDKVESIVNAGNYSLIVSLANHKIVKLHKDNTSTYSVGNWECQEVVEKSATQTASSTPRQKQHNNHRAQVNIQKLFPLEIGLESIPTTEDAFFILMKQLVVQ